MLPHGAKTRRALVSDLQAPGQGFQAPAMCEAQSGPPECRRAKEMCSGQWLVGVSWCVALRRGGCAGLGHLPASEPRHVAEAILAFPREPAQAAWGHQATGPWLGGGR